MVCTALNPSNPITERLANYLDCHAEALGQDGFAHVSSGWIGQAVLAAALTIYVALIGYRLLLWEAFGPKAALLASLRAGVVLAFAASWPAYNAVVYRVVTDGPAELASQVLPADLAPVTLLNAARRVDFDLASLQGAVTPNGGGAATTGAVQAGAAPSAGAQASQPTVAPILDFSGAMLLISTIGALAALRIAAGVLLGVGPIFIMLGLFDSSLSIFEGWARGLLAVFLGSAAAMTVTTLELNFIESDLVASLSGGPGVNGTSSLLATSVLFAAVMLAVLALAATVSGAFRLPRRWLASLVHINAVSQSRRSAPAALRAAPASPQSGSRAQGVAEAVLRLGRREAALSAAMSPGPRSPSAFGRSSQDLRHTPSPSGQATGRRMAPSSTASSKRRDGLL